MNTLQIRASSEIPELYTNAREKDPVAFARFVAPWRGTAWYVFEWDRADKFFGMQAGEKRTYGLFSLSELSKLNGPGGSTVSEDYAFQPTRMSELRRLEKRRQQEKGIGW